MFIAAPIDSKATAQVYRSSKDSHGFVMNLTRAWAWRPDVFDGFAALRSQLTGTSTFNKKELAVMVCSAAAELGDSYCSLAWGKTLANESTPGTAASVIQGSDLADLAERDRALAAWARKVARDPNATAQGDIEALRKAGLSDREIFEATVFIAFRIAFLTVNDALGVSPDGELFESVPNDVRESVTFGRTVADA
jgi:uncharacterized peroxidase-related enzyme